MHVDIKEEPQFNEDFDVDFDQSEQTQSLPIRNGVKF